MADDKFQQDISGKGLKRMIETIRLFDEDSHQTLFEGCVLSCEQDGDLYKITLNQTMFFPEEGGQSCDRGTLNDIPVEKVLEILDAAEALSNVESLDNSEISEGYREKKVSHISEEDRNIELIDLKMVIGSLSERERQVIVLRYFKDMTQQQIAGKMGISQVQVSRIEKKVLKSMREKMVE